MTVLVTGAAGFIGFHLARRLIADGHQVYGVDNIDDYYDPSLKHARLGLLFREQGFSFQQLDIAGSEAKKLTVKADRGTIVTVTIDDKTSFMRAQPGAKSLEGAVKISLADVGLRDRVLALGRVADDRYAPDSIKFSDAKPSSFDLGIGLPWRSGNEPGKMPGSLTPALVFD